MIPGTERARLMDEPLEWPPSPAEARRAALTVADVTGDAQACSEVLEALGLREVL